MDPHPTLSPLSTLYIHTVWLSPLFCSPVPTHQLTKHVLDVPEGKGARCPRCEHKPLMVPVL